jgi:hypothetical protein
MTGVNGVRAHGHAAPTSDRAAPGRCRGRACPTLVAKGDLRWFATGDGKPSPYKQVEEGNRFHGFRVLVRQRA